MSEGKFRKRKESAAHAASDVQDRVFRRDLELIQDAFQIRSSRTGVPVGTLFIEPQFLGSDPSEIHTSKFHGKCVSGGFSGFLLEGKESKTEVQRASRSDAQNA